MLGLVSFAAEFTRGAHKKYGHLFRLIGLNKNYGERHGESSASCACICRRPQ